MKTLTKILLGIALLGGTLGIIKAEKYIEKAQFEKANKYVLGSFLGTALLAYGAGKYESKK